MLNQVYVMRLEPDELILIDWAALGSDSEPVIRAAESWLQRQTYGAVHA